MELPNTLVMTADVHEDIVALMPELAYFMPAIGQTDEEFDAQHMEKYAQLWADEESDDDEDVLAQMPLLHAFMPAVGQTDEEFDAQRMAEYFELWQLEEAEDEDEEESEEDDS